MEGPYNGDAEKRQGATRRVPCLDVAGDLEKRVVTPLDLGAATGDGGANQDLTPFADHPLGSIDVHGDQAGQYSDHPCHDNDGCRENGSDDPTEYSVPPSLRSMISAKLFILQRQAQ